MTAINYHEIDNPNELDVLLGKESTFNDFCYSYDKKTIELLKKNFTLRNSLYLLASHNGAFAGFVSCDTDWWEPGSYFLRELFVAPEFQGQKIGTTLMERCIKHAREHAATTLVTQTAHKNVPMQALCESQGFTQWSNPRWNAGITYKLVL